LNPIDCTVASNRNVVGFSTAQKARIYNKRRYCNTVTRVWIWIE